MNKNKEIPITYISDDYYCQHMGVSIISLFNNKNKDTILKLYIIDCGISKDNLEKIKFIEKKYKQNFIYIKVDINDFKDYSKSFHLNHTVWFKIMLPKIIDEKKFIYIDCDTIITKDLLPLLYFNLEGYPIGGVKARSEIKHIKEHPEEFYNLYINAGVMLINKDNWNKKNLTDIVLSFAKNHAEKLPLLEQDAINYTCQDYIKIINKEFNFEVHHFLPFITKIHYYKLFNKNKISIIHYIGRIKPWHFLYNGPFKKQYKKYLKISPWKDYKYPDKTFINLVKKVYFLIAPNCLTKILVNLKLLIK